ncbi:Protein translation factor SUI1 homolog 1 [Olea europaea subsp. europaea]|uniref:Protein translation factor SUI1 homolog 1 n=1 Tax=Olea europaea subsp. europaea TaxID=158383 RepID=A0A8S0V4J3_OLEEU|nr:Protein translation factor SUI1 homolog 1 [Olea europaea subsp. europaea]
MSWIQYLFRKMNIRDIVLVTILLMLQQKLALSGDELFFLELTLTIRWILRDIIKGGNNYPIVQLKLKSVYDRRKM